MEKKVLLIGLFGLLVVLLVTTYLSAERYICDDAVITYRFCQNLLQGKGLVAYDNGPPVEGYSNPTLLFGTALLAKMIGVSDLQNIIRIGMLINFLALFLCAGLLILWGKNDWSWIAGFALVLFYPTHIYRNFGLETWLYTLFFTLSIYGFAKKKYHLALAACTLAALSRPEGIGLAAWLIAVYLYQERKNWREHIAKVFFWVVIPCGAFLIWRYWYFGHLLSMSSIAKSHISDRNSFSFAGISYLLKACTAAPFLLFLSLLTIGRFIRRTKESIYEITGLTFQLFFIFAVGGDEAYFQQYRFLIPVLPILFRSLGEMPRLMPKYQRVTAISVTALALLCPTFESWGKKLNIHWFESLYNEISGAEVKDRLGNLITPQPTPADVAMSEYLRDHVRGAGQGMILTSVQGGGLPLHWRGVYHDMYGLMNYDYAIAGVNNRNKVFENNQPDIFANFFARIDTSFPEDEFMIWSDFPIIETLYRLGYRPTLFFFAVIPTNTYRGKIYKNSEAGGFLLYTRDPSIINIDDYNFTTKVRFYGEIIETPVVIVKVPA